MELGCFDAGSMLKVSAVTGGITNQLFRVSSDAKSVLVRVYGGEGLIDRDAECATFAAVSEHLGRPAFLGRFTNGRVEEFLEHHATLDLAGLRTHASKISVALKRSHAGPRDDSSALQRDELHLNVTRHGDHMGPITWVLLHPWRP